MKKLNFILHFLLLFIVSALSAQQNFGDFYRNTDPARDSSDPVVKKALHLDFLEKAINNNDTLKIILANLYLANDLFIETKYSEAINQLIQANNLAEAKNDTLLLGRINHKKGAVYSTLENYPESIKYYELGLRQSTIARDSQYIAISLEQLGRMFSNLKNYEKSNEYYQQAIPMVKKFCGPKSLSTTFINYGNSLDEQDSVSKAIRIYKEAIAIGEEIQDDYEIIPAKQNLALVYAKIDSLDQALKLYQECRRGNEKNGWLDFLIYTYDGLALTHEKLGNTDSAYYYFQKHHVLKDSVIGARVQNQVLKLEAQAKIQQKNIDLLTQKEETLKAKQTLKNIIIVAVIILAILSLFTLYYFQKNKEKKRRLAENRNSLKELSVLLAAKNAELRDSKVQAMAKSVDKLTRDEDPAPDHINYYDMSILTNSDWQTFKSFFERSYPNYLQKIRSRYPYISQAEERLFLFIKLQISTSEAANILGVQPETIKKTRTRLRKRLGLTKEENLNDFIYNFDKIAKVSRNEQPGSSI